MCTLTDPWVANRNDGLPRRVTMRFGSTAKVLLKCKLKYYRISECVCLLSCGSNLPCIGLGQRDRHSSVQDAERLPTAPYFIVQGCCDRRNTKIPGSIWRIGG